MTTPRTLLAAELSTFHSVDLLQRSAAAQLAPENAQRLLRLEYFSAVASTIAPSSDSPRMSAGRFRQILQGGMGISRLEDPFSGPFAASFAFVGGDYTVLPGATDHIRPGIDALLFAVMHNPAFAGTAFRRSIVHPIQALLRLSNAMCRSAGLPRVAAPLDNLKVTVPSGARLSELVRSVTWSIADLTRLFRDTNLAPRHLDPFVLDLGTLIPPDCRPGNEPLVLRPLIRHGVEVVIALPHTLLVAIWRFVADTAKEYGVLEALTASFHDTVVDQTSQQLDLMGLVPLDTSQMTATAVPGTTEQLRRLDIDKLLHVTIATDDFTTYDSNSPLSEAYLPSGSLLEDRLRTVIKWLSTLPSPPREVLSLVVLGGIARHFSIQLTCCSDSHDVFILHLDELTLLSYLEPKNPLYLWHFARCRRRLCARAELISWTFSDELFFYRKNKSSFYLADDHVPNVISLEPNAGGGLILEALTKYDPHSIRFSTNTFLECVRVYPGSDIPIYCPRFPSANEPCQCVEIGEGAIWVRTRIADEAFQALASQVAIHCVDAVTFWLGRMKDEAFVQEAAQQILQIEIAPIEPQRWRFPESKPTSALRDLGVVITLVGAHGIRAELPPESMDLLSTATGAEERVLLAPLFEAIATHVGHSTNTSTQALKRFICSPSHRKIVPTTSEDIFALRNRLLPPIHTIPAAAEQEVLDDVCLFLTAENVPIGLIPAHQRTSVLNSVVKTIFLTLAAECKELNPHGLLHWLVAHNEAIIDEQTLSLHREPYYLSCFAEHASTAFDFVNRFSELTKADACCRFLIEYLAACPPSGTKAMSYGTFDRLMALASKIITFGMSSDDIQYGTDNPRIARLPSGRLGIASSRRQAAHDPYMRATGVGKRARLQRSPFEQPQHLRSKWERAAAAIEAAAQEEFGFALTQYAELVAMALALSSASDESVTTIPQCDFLAAIQTAVGVDTETAKAWLSALSLVPRDDFFAVPAPAQRTDVYPWRYNRSWSYVRRPFLISGEQVIFGTSHVSRAGAYLHNLCMTGRLKACTHVMQEAIGRITNVNGAMFNRLVAELFRCRLDLIVMEQVKRIGGRPIASEAGTLGDIDVLVAQPSKRRLRLYECKDLSVGRTPPEIANELSDLSEGEKSIVAKHRRRIRWVRDNTHLVLQHLGIKAPGSWDVSGAIIVDEELMSPFLVNLPLRVLSIADVESLVATNRSIL